jgi:16S rRNA (cytidine1402-2'-O)-methyltransferase
MPSVSDPGLRAVRAVVEAGLPVTAVPGPSAALTALAVSGLPSDRFCFEGFPPRTAGKRAALFASLAAEPRTMLFFESPRRTAATLSSLAEAFGPDRAAAVCRELTKTYEEVVRGTLAELAGWAEATEVLGEVTLVVGGAVRAAATAADLPTLVAEVRAHVSTGMRLKDAVTVVATTAGIQKRALYEAATSTPPATTR